MRPAAWLTLVAVIVGTSLATAVPASAALMAKKVRFIETNEKVIALTFDDGYSPGRSLQIAAILDRYGITGTFFPYANAVAGNESTWRSIANRFPIGNHTITHGNLRRMTAAQVYEEIDGARRIIENATGRRMVRVFRPPYMAYNDTVREQAYRAGFETMTLWSVDSEDGLGLSAQRVYERAIGGSAGQIVLLHAGPPATVGALPRIIEHYRARGFRFVTIPEMLGMHWSRAPGTNPPAQPPPAVGPTPPQLLGSEPVYLRRWSALRAVPD